MANVRASVEGLEVLFPFEPYKCQLDYMASMIKCLQKGENGILESPTGTGKTLSLLCSSLAWLETQKAKLWLMKVASRARLRGELWDMTSSGGGSLDVSLTVSKYLFELLASVGINDGNVLYLLDLTDKLANELALNTEGGAFARRGAGLNKVTNLLKFLPLIKGREVAPPGGPQAGGRGTGSEFYRTFVSVEEQKWSGSNKQPANPWESSKSTKKVSHRVHTNLVFQRPAMQDYHALSLHYWCFSAGSAMQDLVASGVHCIILTSGTLSPLSSFKTEMRMVKSSILGSREQLCINSKVVALDSNSAKTHLCRQMTKQRACYFHTKFDDMRQKTTDVMRDVCGKENNVMDIEDLVTVGRKKQVCPFYMTKEGQGTADIIFMPYNYLLDPTFRKINNIDVANCVLIFDEAHNLEQMCEDCASTELRSSELAMAINEVQDLLTRKLQQEGGEEVLGVAMPSAEPSADYSVKDLSLLKTLLLDLEAAIDSLPLSVNKTLKKSGIFLPLIKGREVASARWPERGGAPARQRSIATFRPAVRGAEWSEKTSNKRAKPVESARHLALRLTQPFLYGHSGLRLDFMMHYNGSRVARCTTGVSAPAMQDYHPTEMRIPFPVQLQNEHVVGGDQVFLGIVSHGPDNTLLSSSYQNRSSPSYQKSLGNTLVNIMKVVPMGLLVFFPSYGVMNMCVKTWQDTGILDIIGRRKRIVIEPKGKEAFESAMSSFYEAIKDPASGGATFFAVCRGKVSEGLDFSDVNGRAVVITGLPFPPRMDNRIVLKMEFLKEQKRALKQDSIGDEEW
ncbi:PREDICTED: regulator of telomere elongation helicase 1 homolog [Priapulus caudatus]|uniref:Regulator of telomere elongation helicase 1 homolog n=1 Tax=Priapulus caudatus TaxID=37621 RepID=A0ABM1EGX9_PRICU|nr:PREDICTED: regulator of telomere elongation helicase 1 homolog [Priapulus caudatus]